MTDQNPHQDKESSDMLGNTDPQITVRTITLTPEYAQELLARNSRNRAVSTQNLRKVVRAIENGEWILNGEAVKISVSGEILDGQHRCIGVVQTGIPIETFLIEGLPEDSQDTMDQGKARSLADVLTIHGEANANGLAALIKRFINIDQCGLSTALSNTGAAPTTAKEGVRWLAENPWVREYVTPGKAIGRHSALSGATAGTLMRIFDEIDAEDSRHFWQRVADGQDLPAGSPILALGTLLRAVRDDVRGERNQRYLAAVTIKAWNAFREGETVARLSYRVGGANPERFPEPK